MKRFVLLVICAAALAALVPVAGAASASHAAAARASGLDKEWLKTSMEGDLFEIHGGTAALRKSHNAAVRKLANTLIKDHTKSFDDAAKLAKRFGVDVPTDPTPSEQWELKAVASFRGKAFDRWYASLEVFDHRQDIQETTDEVSDGSAKAVRGDARQDLPILRKHLRLAEAALKASK